MKRRACVTLAIGLLLATLTSCRSNNAAHPRQFAERPSRTAVGQMNPGDWPQSETGSPGAGIPPLR